MNDEKLMHELRLGLHSKYSIAALSSLAAVRIQDLLDKLQSLEERARAADLVRSLADLVGIELAPKAPQEKPFDYKDYSQFSITSRVRCAVIEYLHARFMGHPELPNILEDRTYQSWIDKALVASGVPYSVVEAPKFLKARGISHVNAYRDEDLGRAIAAYPWHGYQNTKNPKAAPPTEPSEAIFDQAKAAAAQMWPDLHEDDGIRRKSITLWLAGYDAAIAALRAAKEKEHG